MKRKRYDVEIDVMLRRRLRGVDRFFIRCSKCGDQSPIYAHYEFALNGRCEHILTSHLGEKGDWNE